MMAYVLWNLVPHTDATWCEQLMRQASRIAINRTVAGVHFPVDSAAGALLGLTLGEYFIHRCRPLDTYTFFMPWRFRGHAYAGADDFDWRLHYDVATDDRLIPAFADCLSSEVMTAPPSNVLAWLWGRAQAEWQP